MPGSPEAPRESVIPGNAKGSRTVWGGGEQSLATASEAKTRSPWRQREGGGRSPGCAASARGPWERRGGTCRRSRPRAPVPAKPGTGEGADQLSRYILFLTQTRVHGVSEH